VENESKIIIIASNLVQAKISPSDFRKQISNELNVKKQNINLYSIVEEFDLFEDSRLVIKIEYLKRVLENFLEEKWLNSEVEDWAWNVNGLNISEGDPKKEIFVNNTVYTLENWVINEVDKNKIKLLLNEINQI
jgi:hypothetical protein